MEYNFVSTKSLNFFCHMDWPFLDFYSFDLTKSLRCVPKFSTNNALFLDLKDRYKNNLFKCDSILLFLLLT